MKGLTKVQFVYKFKGKKKFSMRIGVMFNPEDKIKLSLIFSVFMQKKWEKGAPL